MQNVTKAFPVPDGDPVVAVDDLTLTVEDGETHCLIGTSGCGKTTTMRLVNRLEEPTSGRIWLGDDDVRLNTAGLEVWLDRSRQH